MEQGAPDSCPVKLWAALSQNSILKEKLIDFFDSQTDFSKRLTSWKANSKVKKRNTKDIKFQKKKLEIVAHLYILQLHISEFKFLSKYYSPLSYSYFFSLRIQPKGRL